MSDEAYLVRRRRSTVQRYSPATGRTRRGIPADLSLAEAAKVYQWRSLYILIIGILLSIGSGIGYLLYKELPVVLIISSVVVLIALVRLMRIITVRNAYSGHTFTRIIRITIKGHRIPVHDSGKPEPEDPPTVGGNVRR
jgi:hypothetical protein